MRGADALVQPEQPEPGQLVGRVDEDPGRGEEVLDVGGVGEPQPAELHVRDLPRAQLDLQHVAVMRGANQHRLVAQRGAVLVRLEHPGADLPRLGGLVVAADEQRGHPLAAVAGQRQVQARRGRPDAVGQVQDALPGPVVAVQPDDIQPGIVGGELPQVGRIGAAEAVDGLRVVAHAGQLLPIRLQQPDDAGLDGVDVLVLVHQDRVEHAAQHRAGRRVGQRRLPQQQQVVEVQQVPGPLARRVGAEQRGQLRGERLAPREAGRHHLADRPPGVDAAGVDVRARRRPRCPLSGAVETMVRPQHVQQVGGVALVQDGELRRQRERLRVLPDDLVRDGVEGPAADSPGRALEPRPGPGEHVAGGAAGEGQQQDPAGRHPLAAVQPRRPSDQRPSLPGARPGQHQERTALLRDRPLLLLVQPVEHRALIEHAYEHNQADHRRPVRRAGRV